MGRPVCLWPGMVDVVERVARPNVVMRRKQLTHRRPLPTLPRPTSALDADHDNHDALNIILKDYAEANVEKDYPAFYA